MTTDLRTAVRRRKPDQRRSQLKPRPPSELVVVGDIASSGRPVLVLDTNVYIADAAGDLPFAVTALIDRALLFHCSVCLGELAAGVGNANPAGPRWRSLRDHYAELFDSIPATRVLTPRDQMWVEAGMIAGTLARSQGFQKHQLKACLNDALIYLTAANAGIPVLTSDRGDFDLIQQLAPEGQFVYFQ